MVRLQDGVPERHEHAGYWLRLGAAVLYFAERFPQSKVAGVARLKNQQDYIMETAAARGLNNLVVVEGGHDDCGFWGVPVRPRIVVRDV